MSVSRVPLDIAPGLYKNGTMYQAKGRWADGNLVRFVGRSVQPVGGWTRALLDSGAAVGALTGAPRGAISWRSDAGDTYVAFATTCKIYILSGGVLYDITPAGFVCDPDTAPAAGGYGSGSYGVSNYNSGASTVPFWEPGNWHLDTFGDYLLAMYSGDNRLFVWEGQLTVPAVVATGSPSGTGVVVTPERFAVVFGADFNVRRAEWATQETLDDWTPTVSNSAGGFEIASPGRIIAGKRTKNETLLWTDTDLHAMQYIGGSLVYRFTQIGEHCGIIAPRAVAVLDTAAIWMGRRAFYMYDGYVKAIPSDVHDYVFGSFNNARASLVWATTVAEFGEVWWFYPSAASTTTDRYVVYNYREGHWSAGTLARGAGVDAGATRYPTFIANTGEIYEHETGQARFGGTAPFLESGPLEIGSGDRLMNIQRVIPDEKNIGDVAISLYAGFDPTLTETVHGPFDPIQPTDVRVLTRQVRVRLDEQRSTAWRIGQFRLAVRESDRRGVAVVPFDYYSQYYDGFAYAIAGLPTAQWERRSNAGVWNVVADAAAEGGKIAQSPNAGVGWDVVVMQATPAGVAVPTSITQRVLAKLRIVDRTRDRAAVIVRYAGATAAAAGNSIAFAVTIDGTNLLITQMLTGAQTTIATTPFAATPGTWYRMKVHALESDQRFKVKVWADGTAEPSTWQINVAIPNVSSGGFNSHTSLGRFGIARTYDAANQNQMECDVFSADVQ